MRPDNRGSWAQARELVQAVGGTLVHVHMEEGGRISYEPYRAAGRAFIKALKSIDWYTCPGCLTSCEVVRLSSAALLGQCIAQAQLHPHPYIWTMAVFCALTFTSITAWTLSLWCQVHSRREGQHRRGLPAVRRPTAFHCWCSAFQWGSPGCSSAGERYCWSIHVCMYKGARGVLHLPDTFGHKCGLWISLHKLCSDALRAHQWPTSHKWAPESVWASLLAWLTA